MAKRIAVVVSQGQSNHPEKRQLEEDIVAGLMLENGIDVTVIPNLYDLKPDGTGMLALQGISGNMVVLSWLYPRAAHWLLDRNAIRGQVGPTLFDEDDNEDEEDEELAELRSASETESAEGEADKMRVVDLRDAPKRKIYCLDLKARPKAEAFIAEVKRIADENRTQLFSLDNWLQGSPTPDQLQRYQQPRNHTALPIVGTQGGNDPSPGNGTGNGTGNGNGQAADAAPAQVTRVQDEGGRRWYPVIDFSRCTNCMECIDFCLFGVYGVDQADTILVEQPDNCRKGCPACSRVCPENAIIFPQHKTPAIAGGILDGGSLKIDLSQLFGAPSAVEVAAQERDEQLVAAGRDAVGLSVGIPKRQADKSDEPKDDLDNLIDELDDLDL